MSENQYVVFKLGKEEYGIDIMNVKEIGSYKETVKVPNTPKFIDGIINYRGKVIPIINLKKRFNLENTEINADTRVIIINLNEKQIGFVVDEASQTVRLNDNEIDPAPDIISSIDRKYIIGVGKLSEERLIIIIDLEKVLNDSEKSEIEQMKI
ncbi:purine-binding chemotaxis protein CheW [Acidilutibacter cellobiosedens]|jgi:purine-binding chemotaxis protein CheW|uniref:Purine-binding chemotaxis protein CheW n=1 Tax=Acidilutibacter cellobiosedens TaxID=2507161 RepID=A0A410QEF4_9FIRM|nr:chemotaxis protein CheW [Acidilutibacter cellobiosedens]MBE6083555.1 purine-binding chemotaxis protein CheW [Tissierellaceae bacterium]QAT62294.1 purine-binding chemotaxis protein CheW [Acidilutibacter cellobiosedens]